MASRGSLHARLLSGAAVLTAAFAGVAGASERTQYNIAPQSLDSALREFGFQSGHTILVDTKLTRAKSTQGFADAGDPETALRRVLAGTGLSFQRDGDIFAIILAQNEKSMLRTTVSTVAPAETVSGSAIEGLVVTAQKRRENIQDVPIAISAFSQDKLEISQIAGGPDLITQVPNMTFTKTNFSGYSIQIRGIGTQAISATTDPAVSVSHNNTSFIRNRFFEQEFYDLERIEVLRGPQGTLYGRNATAGVVNLITAKPVFDYETKTSVDLGNFESKRIEVMGNLPLVEDKAALRLAAAWTKRDGYATNELTGEAIDDRNLWSSRMSLRLTPNDNIDANLIWEHFEEEDGRLRSGKQLCKKNVVMQVGDVPITNYLDTSTAGGQGLLFAGVQGALSQGCERNSLYARSSFQRPNGLMLPYYKPLGAVGLPAALNDPYVSVVNSTDPVLIYNTNDQPEDLRVIASTTDPKYHAKSDLMELQISFDLNNQLTLSSETAYAADTVYSLQDFNRFNTAPGAWEPTTDRENVLNPGPNGGIFCDPQLGCSDRLVAVDISTAESRTFSQEFRLASSYDGPFNFSVGANFLRYDTEDKYYVFINSLSLISARGPLFTPMQPYIPGATDNSECMPNGYQVGDSGDVYAVAGCTYMDPNPIEHVNDQGHNYFLSKNPYKLISYAAFGEAYWNITENLKVTAGLRFTVDKKEAPRIPTWILASQTVGYPVAEVIEQEWNEPTGRIAMDWKPDLAFTDETLFYASYAHGYKAGGANPPGYVRIFYADVQGAQESADESATRPKTFDPEFVEAFEVGTKNTLADGAVTLNLAGFYYDYQGYQISEIVDRSAFNRNFDATVWGLELEADWQVLENLRFGLKVGYEKTRIKDGEQAIDLMDRTAGDPNWLLVRPFPTYASSCILPTFVFENPNGTIGRVGGVGGGGPSGCEIAYQQHLDPVTHTTYVDLTQPGAVLPPPPPEMTGIQYNNLDSHPGYPGWDPTLDYGANNGEGIFKQLGGNELPNAPNWTATFTTDYTIPLGTDWTFTLHGDFYYQAEAWWRVFNDHEYNKLDEYHTINLAAILRNEDSGWNVMGYIKNVTDETAITGAFLNSDDTGLTTNVFLTEPRLYGVRVSKNWSGLPFWKQEGESAPHDPNKPYLFTVEVGGTIHQEDAPNATLGTQFSDEFQGPLAIMDDVQDNDLDWGDGRDIKLTVQPDGGPWKFSGAFRYGKTNGESKGSAESLTDPICLFGGDFQYLCDTPASDPKYDTKYPFMHFQQANNAQAEVRDKEKHQFIEFAVGRDVNIGGLSRSTFNAGLRYGSFTSKTEANLRGIPNWEIPEGAFVAFYGPYNITHTLYNGTTEARREFEGQGPFASWEAGAKILDWGDAGHVDVDWSAEGGVLFGKQTTTIDEDANTFYVAASGRHVLLAAYIIPPTAVYTDLPDISIRRKSDATVPTASGSLGLSYTLDAVKIGAGYRWERYFDVLDGGYATREKVDRTIDGPYFKVAVGFGG